MSGSPQDPQAALLAKMSDEALLDAVCPPEAAAPKLVSSKSAHCLTTQSVEALIADESLAGELCWVVHGLVPEDAFVIVYGGPKVGKGTLVTNIARCVIAGEPFAGRDVQTGEVLWLDLEQTRWLTRRKFEEEGAFNQLHQVHIYNGVPPKLSDIEATIIQLQPKLVVIDSLSRLLLLEDENSAAEVTSALDPIVQIAHRTRTAIIAIHHARKSEGPHGSSMRGSSAFFAVSDVALEVKRCSEDGSDARRKLVGLGRYDEANETVIVRRTDNGYVVEESPAQRRRGDILRRLQEAPSDVDTLVKHFGVRRNVIQSDLGILVGAGRALRFGTGRRGDPHTYRAI